jgi:protease PrsW
LVWTIPIFSISLKQLFGSGWRFWLVVVFCGIIDQVQDTTGRAMSKKQNPDEQGVSNPNHPPENQEIKPQQLANKLSQRITNAAGVEQLEGFKLGEMFSEVFKKHTDDEVEAYFTVGTAATIPDILEVDTTWPRPWVFLRIFGGAMLVYMGFVQAWQNFQAINLIPGAIVVGSFVVPLSVLIFFFETNVRRNVSLYQVIKLLFFGGILSLIFSLILFRVIAINALGASVAGLVEEPGKLLALLLVIYIPKYKYTLNGLLFGAAVGTGFAAFESAGYALTIGITSGKPQLIFDIILLRGMLAPFAHIVWTAMSAAALWKVKGDRPFQLGMIQDARFLRVFGIAVFLHMLWNSPIELPLYGKYVGLGFVAWVVILALIQDGLKQLRVEKIAAMPIEIPENI